jgi:hypothetical protein
MKHPAAYLIRQYMLDTALGVWDENASTQWKVFLGSMPDAPDDALCVYETTPMSDGRLMRGGRTINHPGVQIKARGTSYLDTFRKLEACRLQMQFAAKPQVTLEDSTYILHNLSPQGDILALGQEHGAEQGTTGTARRWLFTLNLLCTISPAPALSDSEELAQVKAP